MIYYYCFIKRGHIVQELSTYVHDWYDRHWHISSISVRDTTQYRIERNTMYFLWEMGDFHLVREGHDVQSTRVIDGDYDQLTTYIGYGRGI